MSDLSAGFTHFWSGGGNLLPLDDASAPGKPCHAVPCPPFGETQLEYDATFVPTLEDLRQAGGPYAGPPGYYYTIRDDRVVLLPTPRA